MWVQIPCLPLDVD